MPAHRSLRYLQIAALLVALAPTTTRAQDYPTRPIRLIITTPAGSLVDVMGRLVADELGARLGQPIVIDNRPGGMTQIGAEALNRAPPDGYTLMIGTSELAMLPFLKKSYRLDPIRDFTPIALLTTLMDGLCRQPEACRRRRCPSSSAMPRPTRASSATAAAASAGRCTSRSRC